MLLTAVVTPLTAEGEVHWEDLKQHLWRQLQAPVEGLVIWGTTSEAPTLSAEEKLQIWKLAKKLNQSLEVQKQLWVGVSENSTWRVVNKIREFNEEVVSGFLIATPSYNKPPQEGLIKHFRECDKVSRKPLMLYNVPSRTGVNLEPESVVEIVRGAHNEILVKEANPSYAHILKLFQNLRENGLEKEVKVLSGNDDMGYGILQLGGEGMVSVTSNVYPQEVEKLIRQTREGQTEARATFFELLPNMQECFEKTNPISVKQVMANKGLIRKSKVRLPLE